MIIRLLAICLILPTANAIVVPTKIERIENPRNRDLINPDTELTEIEVKKLSRTVNCLISFVETHMNQLPEIISVFLTTTDDPIVSSVYLSKLQKVRATYLLTGDLESTSHHNSSLNALLILSSYEHLNGSMPKLVNLCGRDCRYGVVITRFYPDEESFTTEAEDFVELFWKSWVANVVILGTVGRTLLAVQSRGFQRNMSMQPEPPILIASCQNNRWINQSEVFPTMKLNNSSVSVAYTVKQPYIDVSYTRRRQLMSGIEWQIVCILAEYLEFQPLMTLMQWGTGQTLEQEVAEEFQSGSSVHFVIGGIHWTRINGADFALPYDIVKIVWVVPATSNISFLGLITPFDTNMWLLTIASILFGSFLKLVFFPKVSFLEIFSLVIGVAWHNQPIRVSYRIKFLSWVIFGYVLTQVYLASLAGQLMASADDQIDSMNELLDSGLSFGGTASHKMLFEPDDHSGDMVRQIYENFVVLQHDAYLAQWEDMMHGRNSAMALVVVLNISSMETAFNSRYVHALKETLARFPLSFPTRKSLPYLTQIDRTLAKLIEGGIITFIARNASSLARLQHDDDDEEDAATLELNDLVPSFLLLIVGHGVALLCLLAECATARCLRRKRTKKLKATIERKSLVKKSNKKVTFDENNLKSLETSYNLRNRVIRPNITIGYYDHTGKPWKIA